MLKHHSLELFTALTLSCVVMTGCADSDYDGTAGRNTDRGTIQDGQVAAGPATFRDADTRVLQTLHEKNLEQVAVGRMAVSKGASEEVRTFGQRLVDDHTRNNVQVKKLADEFQVTLSAPKTKAPSELALAPLSGADFDQRFATLMHEGIMSLVRQIETAQSEVSNSQVKSLLAETLPGLRDHQQMAQELGGQVGAGNQAKPIGQGNQKSPGGG